MSPGAAPETEDAAVLALQIKLDRRHSVSDQIYAGLRQAIVSLRLPPGTSISENRICRQIGVSRTPVREAIIRLVEDDLIEVFPQQGSFVAAIKLSTIKESHFIRKALELAVLGRAAALWTPAAAAQARGIIAEQQAAVEVGDDDLFHGLDEQFHRHFCVWSALEGVWDTIQDAKTRVDRVHRLAATEGRRPSVVVEHAAIIDALDEGDAEAAAIRLDYHLDRIFALLDMLIEQNSRYFVA
jgi:DNA-binding GntR family transcriptional regulator